MNEQRRRVILYGDSLILDGVRATLESSPGIEVRVLDQPLDRPLEALHPLCPAALIFDLEAEEPEFPLALLQQPGLLLVGIDPETHDVLVWSGRQATAASAADLVSVIRGDGAGLKVSAPDTFADPLSHCVR
jgi:hypothetical protein